MKIVLQSMLTFLLLGLLITALDVKDVLAQGPDPVISGPTPSNQATIDVTIDFDDSGRAILGTEIDDPAKVEIVAGTVSGKVSLNSPQDTVWLVTIDRSGGNSDVNVTVHPGWYQDEAENWNHGASKLFIYDDTAPDIGITYLHLSRTVVGQGYAVRINVTLCNYGNATVHCNVTLSANTTVIHAFENVPLTSGNITTITFEWNTTGIVKGNYTISSHVSPLLGESNVSDNDFIDGWVFITIPGDVDGDRDVDIYDIVAMAGAYGTVQPGPPYSPNCDIDGDGDIDIYDIVIAAGNYGKTW